MNKKPKSSITKKQFQGLMKSIAANNTGTTTAYYTDITKSTFSFTGFDTLPSTGAGVVTYYTPAPDAHNNKGICQESYDQGYEDGLKAAKEGDTRIK